MAEHDAPFAHVAYQQPDGTTGVMDNCDAEALHDEAAAVKTENIADGAVTNGKIAAGAVTSTELADGAVTQAAIADGAVGKDQLSQELQESWDSINQAFVLYPPIKKAEFSDSWRDLPTLHWEYDDGTHVHIAVTSTGLECFRREPGGQDVRLWAI